MQRPKKISFAPPFIVAYIFKETVLFPLGITTNDLGDVFSKQIGCSYAELLQGKENTPENRSRAYCQLIKKYPEGLFKGFSYPDLNKHEDYTLQVLSGKRGETASISVAESDSQNSDEEELDLGSDIGSDEEAMTAESGTQVFSPEYPCCYSGNVHCNRKIFRGYHFL